MLSARSRGYLRGYLVFCSPVLFAYKKARARTESHVPKSLSLSSFVISESETLNSPNTKNVQDFVFVAMVHRHQILIKFCSTRDAHGIVTTGPHIHCMTLTNSRQYDYTKSLSIYKCITLYISVSSITYNMLRLWREV